MKDSADDGLFVSIQQAMEIVGVSRRTIYNWLSLGKLRFKRTAGGSVRIERTSLWRSVIPENPSTTPAVLP